MIIRCVDFETCGLSPEDGGIVEIGWCDLVRQDDGDMQVLMPQSKLINPAMAIPIRAMAIHHITNEMVNNAPLFEEVRDRILARNDVAILAAHNSRFENQWWTAAWLDTWRIAIAIAPHAPGHGIHELRYFGKLDREKSFDPHFAMPPHRAAADAYVCAHLLRRFLLRISIEEAKAISTRPAKLPYFTFGQHAYKPIEDVPVSYLEWAERSIKDDEDVAYTVQWWLRRHASVQASQHQPTSKK
jgi:exodeoxyribonuclease X